MRPLSLFEARALAAVAKAAGAGECPRPLGIQRATLARLVAVGLLTVRVVWPAGKPRHFTRRIARPRNFYTLTADARAVMASANPAGALAIPVPPDPRMQKDGSNADA